MIWLTWRQARAQTLIATGILALLGIYVVILGLGIQDYYDKNIVGCLADNSCQTATRLFTDKYRGPADLAGAFLLAIPALIGIFWGAPLVTRELETGTHKLVWNQSVTRTRWLATKLIIITLISLALTAAFSFLLTWAVDPVDQLIGSRFAAITFDSRDIVPLAYAVFAFALGTTIGLMIRRTLPAMAVTLAVFAIVQIVTPNLVRPHLMSPITSNVAFTKDVAQSIDGIGSKGGPENGDTESVGVTGYNKPGAWLLSEPLNALKNADGSAFTRADMKTCMTGDFEKDLGCLAAKNLHFSITYHPASRYWPFQWIEASIYLALALGLVAVSFLRIRRVT